MAVVQLSDNHQICAQFDFQNNLTFQVRPDNGGRVSDRESFTDLYFAFLESNRIVMELH